MGALMAILGVVGSFLSGVAASSPTQGPAVISGFRLGTEFSPNDPVYRTGVQWGLPQIGAPQAWDVTLGSRNVIVAVVDTGVVWTHPDLQANMWTNTADGTHGYDFVDGDTNPTETDPSGVYHGTGVSGVIAAVTDNGQWIAGTAQVSLMALRALGSNGQGSSFNTSQAIRWAVDHGAKIINLSLGTNETFGGPTDIELAINYAWSKGALIVAAAGNAGSGTLDYPARLPNVVSVAAIDRSGSRAYFSNYGPGLDFAAPGDEIWTLNGNNDVHALRGTSFSAPFVSAAAALLLSVDRNLTNVDLWNILNSTAVQPSGSGYNTIYGWGVVNVWNAINALRRPFISLTSYPTSVSTSAVFGVSWRILGPAGLSVSDTHVVWGTSPSALGNTTTVQSGQTQQSYTAGGLSMPSGAGALYFKVVATVNGTTYTSQCAGPGGACVVNASSLPDFLFVLYQLLASNLLYLALFILALAAVVAFIPQRRAARARRAAYPPRTMYPPSYYVQAAGPTQPAPAPPPAPPPVQPRQASAPPPVEFVRPAGPPVAPTPVTPPTFAAGTKKRCPNCGTMVNADNMFCFFCGHPFR
ncbi:MAG TPA: S8 family serine peptidase [Thermoplasmata archaeon]|nr:S8 family serine peptidase [Thermoplasmata archaeon]